MARKVFVSFKAEDATYKRQLQDLEKFDVVDKSLKEIINSYNEDYIMQKIIDDYLADSTVTIHLIGEYGAESRGSEEQRYIKRELQASLYDGSGNTKNGIVGVVLPSMTKKVFEGNYSCLQCAGDHSLISIGDQITVKEFSYNYFIPNDKCSHREDERYCVLATWDSFVADPTKFIDQAFNKRDEPISKKTKVRP
jgi:MTH538 TIR-like domain (DUF1863)